MKQHRDEKDGLLFGIIAAEIILMLFFVSTFLRADGPADDLVRAGDVCRWINGAVEYVASPAEIKTPAYTLIEGGDCADMSALMLSMLEDMGIRSAEMLLLDLDEFDEHHAVVQLYGWIFDPTTGAVFRDSFPLPHVVRFEVGYSNLLADWKQETRGTDGL